MDLRGYVASYTYFKSISFRCDIPIIEREREKERKKKEEEQRKIDEAKAADEKRTRKARSKQERREKEARQEQERHCRGKRAAFKGLHGFVTNVTLFGEYRVRNHFSVTII